MISDEQESIENDTESTESECSGLETVETVPVTIMLPTTMEPAGRSERKELLKTEFKKLLSSEEMTKDIEVDYESVSVTAQTIEAKLPADNLEELKANLKELGMRADEILEVQIIDNN